MGLENKKKNGNILVQLSNYQCTIPVHFHVLIFLFNFIFQHAGKNSIRFKDTEILFIFLSINSVDFVMNTILKILKHMSLPKQMVGLILDSFILGICSTTKFTNIGSQALQWNHSKNISMISLKQRHSLHIVNLTILYEILDNALVPKPCSMMKRGHAILIRC